MIRRLRPPPWLRAEVRRALRRPLRSLTTLAQVALAAFVGALAVGLVNGALRSPAAPDAFYLVAGNDGSVAGAPRERAYPLFTRDDAEALRDSSPAATMLEPYLETAWERVATDGGSYRVARRAWVTPGFAAAAGLALVRGDFLHDGQRELRPAAVTDRLALTLFGDLDVVGRRLWLPAGIGSSRPEAHTIVGVVDDSAAVAARTAALYTLLPAPPDPAATTDLLLVRSVPGRGGDAAGELLQATRARFADDPVFTARGGALYTTVSGRATDSAGARDRLQREHLVVSVLALVILLLGLVGVATSLLVDIAEQRRAVALQRALGTSRRGVVVRIVARAALLGGLGAALGLAPALTLGARLERTLGLGGLAISPALAAATVTAIAIACAVVAIAPARIASSDAPGPALAVDG